MLVAVIFEAASTEKCLIGVQGLTTCERRRAELQEICLVERATTHLLVMVGVGRRFCQRDGMAKRSLCFVCFNQYLDTTIAQFLSSLKLKVVKRSVYMMVYHSICLSSLFRCTVMLLAYLLTYPYHSSHHN